LMLLQDPLMLLQDPLMSLQDPLMSLQDPLMSLQDPLMSLQDPLMSLQDPLMSFPRTQAPPGHVSPRFRLQDKGGRAAQPASPSRAWVRAERGDRTLKNIRDRPNCVQPTRLPDPRSSRNRATLHSSFPVAAAAEWRGAIVGEKRDRGSCERLCVGQKGDFGIRLQSCVIIEYR
jgi:hypothetical protein